MLKTIHPLNLALRFVLELVALYAMGRWGWMQASGFWRYVLALVVPAVAAALWGIFRVPGDPGPAPVAVPGIVRLALEAVFFGFAVWALYTTGATTWAWAFAVVVLIHYGLDLGRVTWMLKQ